MRGVGGQVRPGQSDQDSFAIDRILSKNSRGHSEFADLGWADDAGLAVGPIESPRLGLSIAGAQGQTFDVACWAFAPAGAWVA